MTWCAVGEGISGMTENDLIPQHIRSRNDLNTWEQENILEAAQWIRTARGPVLDDGFIKALHRRMFDQSWRWAGRYRRTNKNIGVEWPNVPTEVRKLMDDGRYWLEQATYPVDEVAIRLHHRLVLIHPFPNGNGRHARLWCDAFLRRNGRKPFAWKNAELNDATMARTAYIQALRSADAGDYAPLHQLLLVNRT